MNTKITIQDASIHNLKDVRVEIPHHSFTVVTGISGSGKSSLAFDTLFREGQRRYLQAFGSYARQFMGKTGSSDARISGLLPAISIDQKTTTPSPRSTVGTLSEIYDYLRLYFARIGQGKHLQQSLFSFNSSQGACPVCAGLGVQDIIDPQLLIDDDSKTVREGAFVMTTPSGYIVYSQVTMDVLNDVCAAHGFSVDIPWRDLTSEQKEVILRGSTRLKVPFGKHTLESRLKWSGITAKPRGEGYYTGILTIMEDILKRDRNDNILRFARSVPCAACGGTRLRPEALAVKIGGYTIAQISALPLRKLLTTLHSITLDAPQQAIAEPIITEITRRTQVLLQLGLGYLSLNRSSTTLSGGEAQRIRMAVQTLSNLQNVLYVLDEPSIGLHPAHNQAMLAALKELQQRGNTVVVVEHDEEVIGAAEHIIDIGPLAGSNGGELIFCGSRDAFLQQPAAQSITQRYLQDAPTRITSRHRSGNGQRLTIRGAREHNLKNIDCTIPLGCLTVVCGVSGAGKSTLIETILARHLRHQLHRAKALPGVFDAIIGMEHLKAVIDIDQSAIGRTPRSNPATYTKLFDRIRDLFAAQPLAKERGYKKSRFSFNTKGGRCEACQGAGVQEIGMHFLDSIAVRCEHCGGKRFNAETLEVTWHYKTIYDVLELTVDDAASFFASQPKIMKILNVLQAVGLGYITLGQPSTTLSGGEAQRIKLAAELARSTSGTTLYILDEPTTGLHPYDVEQLLKALHQLVDAGNAVVVIEHHPRLLFAADHIIELGPGSGNDGGEITFTGTPEKFKQQANSPYIQAMHKATQSDHTTTPDLPDCIQIEGAATHNLRNISLQIPHNKLSVITGVSGSGKSSLAFDTLFAEGNRRFTESISTYARRFMKQLPRPAFTKLDGLSPTIAITQRRSHANPRSTVGTYSGLYDHLRLLYSRVTAAGLSAQHFSFNHESGACPHCKGLGFHLVPDPAKIITHPHLAIAEGAMNGHKAGKFYGDPKGQHMAILATVGAALNIDFSKPWQQLDERAQTIAMQGTGAHQWDVVWHYKRKNRTGSHQWRTTWDGLIAYIADEFARKQHDKRANELTPLLSEVACQSCAGTRMRPEVLDARIQGKNIMDIAELELHQLQQLLSGWMQERIHPAAAAILPQMLTTLQGLLDAGLGYLTLMRRSATLSGGEMQRLRLASQLGGDLYGITYILDEPTSGLHPADTQNLIGLLHRLRDAGNTVIVVEHDMQVIGAADQIFDLGPGAGSRGGTIIAQGTPAENAANAQSRTGAYLQSPPAKPSSHTPASGTRLRFRAAAARTLKGFDIEIPTASITTITGVSGSGKSTLLHQVIAPSILHHHPTNCAACELPLDSAVIAITHKPLASSPISSVATYSGVLNHIAAWFAAQPTAKAANLKKSAFLYNSKKGQCPTCKGAGHTRVSMDFMADVWLPCTSCDGQRYRPTVLSNTAENHSIMDVLNFTVEEAATFFHAHKKIHPPLALLCEIGLGYLPLIQSLSTLSGGEAQRLKLAAHLINAPNKHTVFLLDEPTIGLHSADVEVLMTLLHKLKNAGDTIIVVEHNTDVMRQSDWLIDLGPTGGAEGGELIACGTPAEVAANPTSVTGRFLQ